MEGASKQLYLMCGSGGVGKTTLSAALGIKSALAGKKVIVLTVDPARRLATSLGLSELPDEPARIDLAAIGGAKGEMWAMMLDTQRTFDRLVEKYAPSAEARERIFCNKLYQHLSRMLAGTQEYMAMERLYEVYGDGAYDVVVVDTPPMQSAMDFLVAPQKMMKMISNSMLQIFLKPTLAIGRTGLKFLEKGSRHILKVFDKITGFDFLQDISELIISFQGLLAGFDNRAQEVRKLLMKEDTHFVAVCTAMENSITEIENFRQQLKDYEYHLDHVVVNRVYADAARNCSVSSDDINELKKAYPKGEAELLYANYARYQPLIVRDRERIARLQQLISKDDITIVPLYFSDVHDVKSLYQIALCLRI